jgi:hypothetical protein
MNERIREFEKLSGLEVYGLGARREYWDRCTKKFAELIVEECANLFDKDEMELSLTERTIHKTIKEHFGIEK